MAHGRMVVNGAFGDWARVDLAQSSAAERGQASRSPAHRPEDFAGGSMAPRGESATNGAFTAAGPTHAPHLTQQQMWPSSCAPGHATPQPCVTPVPMRHGPIPNVAQPEGSRLGAQPPPASGAFGYQQVYAQAAVGPQYPPPGQPSSRFYQPFPSPAHGVQPSLPAQQQHHHFGGGVPPQGAVRAAPTPLDFLEQPGFARPPQSYPYSSPSAHLAGGHAGGGSIARAGQMIAGGNRAQYVAGSANGRGTGTPASYVSNQEEPPPPAQSYAEQYRAESRVRAAEETAMPPATPEVHDSDENHAFNGENDGKEPTKEQVNERLIRTEQDQLFYSKKARPVVFKPCTTSEYLKEKPKEYFELGKLQADLNTEEIQRKRERQERIREYAAKQREVNRANQARRQLYTGAKGAKEQHERARRERKAQSARQRGLEFAKQVPRPRVRSSHAGSKACEKASSPSRARPGGEADSGHIACSSGLPSSKPQREIEALTRNHDKARDEIEKIRREFGML